MKIIQVLSGITTGGPSYTVPMMCRALKNTGADVELHLPWRIPQELNDIDCKGYNRIRLPIIKHLAYSPSMLRGLKNACKSADIIITNSLWQYPNYITEYTRRGTKCKSVIVPRGTLSKYALSISKVKKRIILAMGQREALKNCDLLVATCWNEYKDIRDFGLKNPVAVIPNGIDIPLFKYAPRKEKRVVYLSRIHPIKGLDVLINSWVSIEKEFPDWKLSIAGPTNDYCEKLKQLTIDLGLENVEFVGSRNGSSKYDFLRSSELFVLPTHSENWGIAVAEALACSLPVICTTGAPWEGLITNNCGDWIDLSEVNLTNSLRRMMSYTSDERARMGENGRKWVEKEFEWAVIGKKTIEAFKWLCGESVEKPDYVYID